MEDRAIVTIVFMSIMALLFIVCVIAWAIIEIKTKK